MEADILVDSSVFVRDADPLIGPWRRSGKLDMRGYWHPNYERYNPVMRPDWRWQRAINLVASGQNASRKRDDEPTCRAVDFIRRLKRAATERTARRITRRYPDIAFASKLQQADPIRRLEFESRVLARQSSTQIAHAMSIPMHIAIAFKDLFFAIDERINASSYIVHRVIGVPGQISDLGSGANPETWMRWAAYVFGPGVIEPWIDFILHQHEKHDLQTAEGWRRDAIEIFLAAKNLSLNGEGASEIVRNLQNLSREWSKTRIYHTAEAVFRDEMMRAVEDLPFAQPEETRLQHSTAPDIGCSGAYGTPARRTRLVG